MILIHAKCLQDRKTTVETNLAAVLGDRGSQWMLAVVLRRSHDGQQPGAGHLVPFHNHLDLDDLWSSVCDGSCLVEYNYLHLQSEQIHKCLES